MAEAPSDPPRNKPDRKDLKKSLPRDAQKQLNEDDLWDFDLESPDATAKSAAVSLTEDHQPLPILESPAQPTDSQDEAEEEVLRIETPISLRRTHRGQRRNLAKKETASWSLDHKSHTSPPELEPQPASIPFIPTGNDPVEIEVWQELDSEDHTEQSQVTLNDVRNMEPSDVEIGGEDFTTADSTIQTPAAASPIDAAAEIIDHSGESPSEAIAQANDDHSEVTKHDATIDEQEEPTTEESTTAGDTQPFSWKPLKLTRLELISCIIFVAFLVSVGVGGIIAFRSNIKTRDNPYAMPKLPAEGQYSTITSADTFWRAPIRSGANAEPVQLDVILTPTIDIQLGSCSSADGAIRVVFYNDKGEITGDILTRGYRDHRFTLNHESTLNFACTKGFANFGEQEAYRAYLVKPWSIRVYEGPNENAPSSAFQLLFTAPVSTKIR
jgi:hypothetical protein